MEPKSWFITSTEIHINFSVKHASQKSSLLFCFLTYMLHFWHIYYRETGLEECVKGFHIASFVMKLYFELSSELRFFGGHPVYGDQKMALL